MGTALSPGVLKCHLKLSGPSFCGKAASLLAPCDGKEPLLPDSSFHKLDCRAQCGFLGAYAFLTSVDFRILMSLWSCIFCWLF